MAIVSKTTVKSYFETGDKPTQAQFADFIDSSVFIPAAGATGFVEVESTASSTTRAAGTFGIVILAADTTASAQTSMGLTPATYVSVSGSSTDHALTRFKGTTGTTVQNSGWTLDDSGVLNGGDNTITRTNLLDYGEVTNAIGSIGGGTQDIDLTLGNSVTATVDTSTTTFTFSNPTASDELCGFVLGLTNGGSQTVNWPASVDWAGGTAPTLTSSGVDWLVFWTVDGGTIWNGALTGAAFA